MLKLVLVFFVALCLAAHGDAEFDAAWKSLYGDGIYTTSDHTKAQNRLRSFEKDFKNGDRAVLAERMNYAMIKGAFKFAVLNLKHRGFYDTAREVEEGVRAIDGELQRMVASGERAIGDFEAWLPKIAILYLLVEQKLSYSTCHLLRLDDIFTFATTPKVIFDPCRYGRAEHSFHFSKDDPESPHPYRGGFPVTIFWLSQISCGVTTMSMGLVVPVCGVLSTLIEYGAREYLSPKLQTLIYDRACGAE